MQDIVGSASKVPGCYTKLKVWQCGILHIERVAHPWRWLSSSLIFEQALLTSGANSHPSWVICFIYSTRNTKNTKFQPRLPGGCCSVPMENACCFCISIFSRVHRLSRDLQADIWDSESGGSSKLDANSMQYFHANSSCPVWSTSLQHEAVSSLL